MKAPEHERMDLLFAAIRRATQELQAPLDRVEVRGDRIECEAGGRTVFLSYGLTQDGEADPATGRFRPKPGSAHWYVEVAEDRPSRRPEQIGLALAKLLKKRGW